MPRLIEPEDNSPDAIAASSLEECAAALEAGHFDPHDPDSLVHAAGWLCRLGNNPDFLGNVLVAQLAARHRAEPTAQGYGPQVVVLTPPGAGAFLRAMFGPAQTMRWRAPAAPRRASMACRSITISAS